MQKIPVFILSLKKSVRIHILTKRLKNININYRIFYGINGNDNNNKKDIKFVYSKKNTIKNIGRELTPPEIGAAAGHLAIYNHIIKKNISQAIIMEDDAYPSKLLNCWVKNKIHIENNEILSFYCYPDSSLIKKKPVKLIFNKKVGIHSIVTHAHSSACYQINIFTCKKIIKLTKNKVTGFPDWPFLINKDKIKLSVTIPFMAVINDNNISNLSTVRDKMLKKNTFIKKLLSEKVINIIRLPYYLSYLGLLFSNMNKNFYFEHFFQKQSLKLLNLFSKKHLEANKIFFDKRYYCKDIQQINKKFPMKFE
jgi:GR25 family glycosyltransferase involved in LPS biosynthesis